MNRETILKIAVLIFAAIMIFGCKKKSKEKCYTCETYRDYNYSNRETINTETECQTYDEQTIDQFDREETRNDTLIRTWKRCKNL